MHPDKTYYFDTYVAGRVYGDADQAWPFLRVGQPVMLCREADNPKDPSAIAVYTAIDEVQPPLRLGYLPLRTNQPLSLLLDMGWESIFETTISRLDPTAPYDRQIGITVRIIRNPNHGES